MQHFQLAKNLIKINLPSAIINQTMKNRLNNHKTTKINDFTFAHVDVPKGIFPHTQFPMGLIHSSHIYSIFFYFTKNEKITAIT